MAQYRNTKYMIVIREGISSFHFRSSTEGSITTRMPLKHCITIST